MELDKGQQTLVADLEHLLDEAKQGEFGDFTNRKYSTPKVMLRSILMRMADNVVAGKYD